MYAGKLLRAVFFSVLGASLIACQAWRGQSESSQQASVTSPPEEQQPVTTERPANPRETQRAFQDKPIGMTETKEEPVVSKRPRQTEEVTLKREAEKKTETIKDTTDVQVAEQGQGIEQAKGLPSSYEKDFRAHYNQNFKTTGASYDQYRPAYHFGYGLATTEGGENWDSIEQQARQSWEEEHPGSWEQLRSAIRYGWERGRQAKG